MSSLIQRSFAGGEISPSVYGRVDLVKYQTGLRTCRNFIIQKWGGAANRPGTGFVGEVKDSTRKVRFVRFVFNDDQTYVLEFGHLYMRVIRNGGQVIDVVLTITGATQANPCVITSVAHGLATGDEVYISGVAGMTELNGRNFKVTVLTADTFSLQYMNGANVNSTGFAAYSSSGTASRIYTIVTPYVEADLPKLQYIQSADTVIITRQGYAPRKLQRSGHASWTLSTITFEPGISRPAGCTGTPSGGAGATRNRYKITAVSQAKGEESLGGLNTTTRTITGITQANPAVVTSAGHGYANGDTIHIDGVVGMTQVNKREFLIANVAANTFELQGIDSTAYTAYSSGGSANRCSVVLDSATAPAAGAPNILSWTYSALVREYNIYKELNGVYGFIGVAVGTGFSDIGYTPDTLDTAPTPRQPFDSATDWPACVGAYQQRTVFGNTPLQPEAIDTSRVGQPFNFTKSSPQRDDDAVAFTLYGREVNEVRHILDLGELIAITRGGEWAILGNDSGALTPFSINAKQQSYNGVSDIVSPVVIDSSAIYVQERGTIVRDLRFSFEDDGYKGNDLSIFAFHLFEGYTIVDGAYAKSPYSVVWMVRSDGTLLGFTYIQEHEIWAWHRHDFDGTVENVIAVPESTTTFDGRTIKEDAVYLVIKRTINGETKRYIERMKTRTVGNIVDSVFEDCSLTYDGRNTNVGHTMTLSGGTTWTHPESIQLTSSAAFFTAADVTNGVWIYVYDATTLELVRCQIVGFTSATVVTVKPDRLVPVAMRNFGLTRWSRAVKIVGGLWHLAGKQVSALGDGFVAASARNNDYTGVTVNATTGQAIFDEPYAVLHVGLPVTADLETLDIDVIDGQTLSDKKKAIAKITLRVQATRGLWAGPKPPTSDAVNPKEFLREFKLRDSEDYDDPPALMNEPIDIITSGEWNNNGRSFIRQLDPVPATILTITPAGYIQRK